MISYFPKEKGMADRFRVCVTDDRYGGYAEEQSVLRSVGADLAIMNLRSEEEALTALRDTDAVLVNLFSLSGRVIAGLERCKVISRYGVGYDNVDVEAATRKGIWVARVPDYSIEDVSDQALALLLACVRKIGYKDRWIRAGGWNLQKDQPAYRVAGKILGLVGFGAIARSLVRKVGGLGLARVLVYDPYVPARDVEEAGARAVGLDVLMAESDYVSVHVPLAPATVKLVGEEQIRRMKKSAILVNTSRGAVVDESALCAALRDGRICGAGLDVFEREPLPPDSPLRRLENVVLSDHTGWYSEESTVELKTKAARNVAAVLAGNAPIYPVNSL
jgi:D-3-phosphoglycerate dehydrogenase